MLKVTPLLNGHTGDSTEVCLSPESLFFLLHVTSFNKEIKTRGLKGRAALPGHPPLHGILRFENRLPEGVLELREIASNLLI